MRAREEKENANPILQSNIRPLITRLIYGVVARKHEFVRVRGPSLKESLRNFLSFGASVIATSFSRLPLPGLSPASLLRQTHTYPISRLVSKST